MTNQIETRCCKVFNIKEKDDYLPEYLEEYGIPDFEDKLFIIPDAMVEPLRLINAFSYPDHLIKGKYLKFTTDRNWCQLLVDEVCRRGLGYIMEFETALAELGPWYKLTPLQIATAALETLEGESEND